jgi:carboxylesterase type B
MSLDCLRSLSLESLLDISLNVQSASDPFIIGEFFTPVVDGDFIPLEPSLLVQSGRFSKLPMIIGWNDDDGSLFAPPTVQTDAEVIAFFVKIFPNLTSATTKRILDLYPLSDFPAIPSENASAQFLRTSRIFRDVEFTCPSLFLALHVSDTDENVPSTAVYHPGAPNQGPLQAAWSYLSTSWDIVKDFASRSHPVFLYDLNQTSLAQNLTAQGFPQLGVSHVADIPYVFDEVAKFNDSASNALLAKQMTGSWSRFATSGHPSSSRGTTLKNWVSAWRGEKRVDLEDARVFVIGGGEPGMAGLGGMSGSLRDEKLPERCGFWMSEKVIRELGT